MFLVKLFFSLLMLAFLACRSNDQILSKVKSTTISLPEVSKIATPTKVDIATNKTTSKKPKIRPVIIDPGHGGIDVGAIGINGINEKNLVLDIAKKTVSYLKKLKVPVEITRTKDSFLTLDKRTQIANENNGSVFVSIHINSSGAGNYSGFEVYYLDEKGLTENKTTELVKRENQFKQDKLSDDLTDILNDLLKVSYLEESIILAHTIESYIGISTIPEYSSVTSRGVQKAPFFVLANTTMPSVLLELFFIDNFEDTKKLNSLDFRDKLALGIAQGIYSYLLNNNI
jgi:N-acetylmuramoyl-L-alanine amidase